MLWMLFNGCTFRSLFITPPLLMNTIMTKVLVHTPAVCTPEWDLPDWVSRSDKRHDAYPFAWHREPDSNIRPWAVHSSRGTRTRLHRRHSAPVSSAYSVRLRVRLYRSVTSASISQDRAPSCHRIIHVRRYVAGSWILGVNEPPPAGRRRPPLTVGAIEHENLGRESRWLDWQARAGSDRCSLY